MHEYSIVQSLMGHIEQQAAAQRAVAVHRVSIRIGELSGIEPDLLRSAFEMVQERTICDGATLIITPVPARWVCRRCGADVTSGGPLRCGVCGEPARLAQGDEIMLDQLELEVGDV